MTETERPALFFLADDPALDFLNSVAAPWGGEIEWLDTGHDLLAWLQHARLVPTVVLKRFREEATTKELDDLAAQARDLREWFRAFVRDHAGREIQSSAALDLSPINSLLARDGTYRQIEVRDMAKQAGDPNGTALHWRWKRRWRLPGSLLLPLAEAMGDLVCHADFANVKHCEGPTCTLWFHDVSKNHTRRWCSMAVCGNRAKAAAHRAKKRAARLASDQSK